MGKGKGSVVFAAAGVLIVAAEGKWWRLTGKGAQREPKRRGMKDESEKKRVKVPLVFFFL
ncbi:hypothetical protein G3578_16445 [Brevibacillus sp. SYP-B805]|uniref:hypothetical protein n=1 Tax=Brevibacillus sp. SYP-B805 TaxID=1578199 RepID=UPI0013E9CC6F|nr:hypothetical protein [Brevibacillus sp. SYP-B805]NGQ96756.1 hypothetical protein [Brevibacillus sp. SYP-B805]